MTNQKTFENPLGTRPMPKLVIATAIPLMISMIINSLYNLVDGIFVARISEEALTALSIVGPIQYITGSLGSGIAVGLNAIISKSLGMGDKKSVKEAAFASMVLAVFAWGLAFIVGLLFAKPYMLWQTSGDQVLIDYGLPYLRIVMLLSLGQMFQWVFDRFVVASGKSGLFLFTLSAASITNLILDPILIFGYFGLPAMGTKGAAYATVIGQFVGAIAGFFINKIWNKEIPIEFMKRVNWRILGDIVKVGIPTTLVQSLTNVSGIFINYILLGFGGTALAVFGAVLRIQNVAGCVIWGINVAIIPIVAYNYGAKKTDRIHSCMKWSLIYMFSTFTPMMILMIIFADKLFLLFDASPNMLAMGVPAFGLIISSLFFCIPGQVICSSFQGLSSPKPATIASMLRQIVLPLIIIIIAAAVNNLTVAWCAFSLSELLVLPLTLAFWIKKKKHIYD